MKSVHTILFVFLALFCCSSTALAAQQGVLINEVMFMPLSGPEWVELYNATGEPQDFDSAWFYDFSTPDKWRNVTVSCNELDGELVPLGEMAPEDFLYLGREEGPFQAAKIDLEEQLNTNNAEVSVEYWNGTGWSDLTVADGTSSAGATLAQSGSISWSAPPDWQKNLVNGSEAFYVRISVDATLSPTVDVDVADFTDGFEVNIAGFDVTNAADDSYTISLSLPPVPAGAFVVIYFDGLGSGADDYDFSDNLAELHSSSLVGDVFTDIDDRVVLYAATPHEEENQADFIAWGDYSSYDKFINVGGIAPDSRIPISSSQSIGLAPGLYDGAVKSWMVYSAAETSPGAANPLAQIYVVLPVNNSTVYQKKVTFSWFIDPATTTQIKQYQLQVDNNSDFSTPEIDKKQSVQEYTNTSDLAVGEYYVRVRTIDKAKNPQPWSTVIKFKIADLTAGGDTADLGVPHKQQRKDTKLVCLLCNSKPNTDSKGAHSWDDNHPVRECGHDEQYCCRAAIAMLVAYFKGNLSQDRISYKAYKGRVVAGRNDDFGHRLGMWPHEKGAVNWALSKNVTQQKGGTKPDFSKIKGWIDAKRPIIWVKSTPHHCVVIDGYDDQDKTPNNADDAVHVIDPWSGAEYNGDYASLNWGGLSAYYVAQADSKGLTDEASLKADPDMDGLPRFVTGKWDGKAHNAWGLMTFDETERFKTDPAKADSDTDCVQDKVEVWSYVENFGGTGRNADQDGDTKRAELDPDTDTADDKKKFDGAEDTNIDGNKDAGETDPFVAADDGNAVTIEYFFQGTSPPVPGIDGAGKSWATMELSKDDKKFHFRSADQILGAIDTQTLVAATRWNQFGGNPVRIVFTGSAAGASFYANVLLEDYLRAVVDVAKGRKRVRYLLKACKPKTP